MKADPAVHFLRTIDGFASKYPDSAITLIGADMTEDGKKKYNYTWQVKSVDILMGYGGYLVKPRFFSEKVLQYPEDLPEAFIEDDVWLSGYPEREDVKLLTLRDRIFRALTAC